MILKKGLAIAMATGMLLSFSVTNCFAASNESSENTKIYYTQSGKEVNLNDMQEVDENELFNYDAALVRQALVWARDKYPNAKRYSFYRDDNGVAYCEIVLQNNQIVIEECIQVKNGNCYVAQ